MEICKNYPLPDIALRRRKDAFKLMEIGDSIVYSLQYEASRVAMKWAEKETGFKFVMRYLKDDKNYRIWRIE